MEKKLVEANIDQQAFKKLQEGLAKERAKVAKLVKENKAQADQIDTLNSQVKYNACPIGFLDVWPQGKKDDGTIFQNATLRLEINLEEAQQIVVDAENGDGIADRALSFETAPNQTNGAELSFQVYRQYCRTYDQDNADKESKGIKYRNRRHSMMHDGRQVYIPKALRKSA
tara:strand:- start:1443 stop:1955 length:513 start_codon:yes stop_codon:yes gene_type:complete